MPTEHGYSDNGGIDDDDDDRTFGSHNDPDRTSTHSGRLHYDDFQVFVEEKEERLWNLFQEIDHNNDNGMYPNTSSSLRASHLTPHTSHPALSRTCHFSCQYAGGSRARKEEREDVVMSQQLKEVY